MTIRSLRSVLLRAVAAVAFVVTPVGIMAQATMPGASLATVRLPHAAMADGQALAAGTYAVRLSDAPVPPVVGQSSDGTCWVEFVQSGSVKGRELATVLTGSALKQVAKEAPPAAGQARVEMLAGAEYLRVWINHAGTNYLVHLPVSSGR
jgi:hypothetical protein